MRLRISIRIIINKTNTRAHIKLTTLLIFGFVGLQNWSMMRFSLIRRKQGLLDKFQYATKCEAAFQIYNECKYLLI